MTRKEDTAARVAELRANGCIVTELPGGELLVVTEAALAQTEPLRFADAIRRLHAARWSQKRAK